MQRHSYSQWLDELELSLNSINFSGGRVLRNDEKNGTKQVDFLKVISRGVNTRFLASN